MGLGSALQAGLSGLNVAQKSIDVAANNIVNSKTDGYTRKIARQNSVVLGGVGVGVVSNTATRMVDEGLNSQLYKEGGVYGALSVKSDYIGRVEDLFGSPESNTSLAHTFSSLASSFEELATEVNNAVSQSTTVSTLSALMNKLNTMTTTIQSMRSEADVAISTDVDEINDILTSIEKLNSEILKCNSLGTDVDDYLDQRDSSYKRLAEIMDVQSFTRSTGEMVIMTSSGVTLLDNSAQTVTHSSSSALSSHNTYSGGDISGIYVGNKDITSSIKSGEMAGLIEVRDTTMPELQAEVDELMTTLATELNTINSRGISYPTAKSTYTSDKTFLNINGSLSTATNPANAQTPKISITSGDVKLVVYDTDGKEVASTSLTEDLGFTSGDIYDPLNYPENDSLLATIQNWLNNDPSGPALINATASINSDGYIEISTGDSSYSLTFRDEASSIKGSEAEDATIEMDLDGDGVFDTTESGFVNALGLNNVITSTSNNWMYDSNVIARGTILKVSDPNNLPTLTFSDEKNINFGSITVSPGDTIDSIAERINSDPTLNAVLEAEVVKEGTGYRLRIKHKTGSELVVSEPTTATGSSIMEQLGLGVSNSALSGSYKLSDTISSNYATMSTGQIQYDTSSGSYYASESDNTIANQFAELFSSSTAFARAGGMSSGSFTFESYASSIVAQVASSSATLETSITYQSTLVTTLSNKSSAISGVNLDEELANLTTYQLSYNAAAKVISTVSEMIDSLMNMV